MLDAAGFVIISPVVWMYPLVVAAVFCWLLSSV